MSDEKPTEKDCLGCGQCPDCINLCMSQDIERLERELAAEKSAREKVEAELEDWKHEAKVCRDGVDYWRPKAEKVEERAEGLAAVVEDIVESIRDIANAECENGHPADCVCCLEESFVKSEAQELLEKLKSPTEALRRRDADTLLSAAKKIAEESVNGPTRYAQWCQHHLEDMARALLDRAGEG